MATLGFVTFVTEPRATLPHGRRIPHEGRVFWQVRGRARGAASERGVSQVAHGAGDYGGFSDFSNDAMARVGSTEAVCE